MVRKNFKAEDKKKMLLWCDRHCCLCGKQCGGNIEINHIDKNDNNNLDNGIPLCFECHGLVHAYENTPKGTKFSSEELKSRREQVYDKHTAHLVPPIHYEIISDMRPLPDIGFTISHRGGPFPVRVKTWLKVFLGKKMIEDFSRKPDFYGGEREWNLNPLWGIKGHFQVPKTAVKSKQTLKVQIKASIFDIYNREHELLPVEYVYQRDTKGWFLEPSPSTPF